MKYACFYVVFFTKHDESTIFLDSVHWVILYDLAQFFFIEEESKNKIRDKT